MKKFLKKHLSFEKRKRIRLVIDKINNAFHVTFDIIFIPYTIFGAYFFRYIRMEQFNGFKISRKILMKVGVFPIIDHYYEPLFNKEYLRYPLREDRNLAGIDFNDEEQLQILSKFNYNDELLKIPVEKTSDKLEYCYNNGSFLSGDAEYLYNMIRLFKPSKIIEVGSGNSTLMARNAIKKNISESNDYTCEHICIEPYEQEWLENIGVKVIRKKVEELDISLFEGLNANDILFIDSSHIIRSQGDVLFLYLEVLPNLNKGVLVHIHDIFSPKDYLDEWFGKYFWNEQYLLEAFLTLNREFRIVGATNYLSHKYYEQFSSKCPIFKQQKGREPGSFWMLKN
ncbi:MAG: class I SAM-dependent methyltransferase [Candidatus Helarchaeota archaeon]